MNNPDVREDMETDQQPAADVQTGGPSEPVRGSPTAVIAADTPVNSTLKEQLLEEQLKVAALQVEAAKLQVQLMQSRMDAALTAAAPFATAPPAAALPMPNVTTLAAAAGPSNSTAVTAGDAVQVTIPRSSVTRDGAPADKRSALRYPAPKEFVPPTDHKADSIMYVEKYLFDLKSYVKYGVAADVPPFLTFSQTSTGTFDLVQEMAARDEALPEGEHMPIEEVCRLIAKRYLPSIDRATDARMRLLGGEVTMRADELLGEYKARFLAELALSARGSSHPPMADCDKMLLYRRGMTADLRDACVTDAQARRLDTFDEVHLYAEAHETRVRMRRGVQRSATQAMIMHANPDPAPAAAPTPAVMTMQGRGRRNERGGGRGRGRSAAPSRAPHGGDGGGPSQPRSPGFGGRGGRNGGRGDKRGRERDNDGFERGRPRAGTNASSGRTNRQGLLLTKQQFFTLLDQQRCWYCGDPVGQPPQHTGDTCPHRR
jgi:hypothetical protein